MKMRIAAVICSTLTGLMVLSSQAVAQQKTIKACQEEWSANKAANQANGITKKSYVDHVAQVALPLSRQPLRHHQLLLLQALEQPLVQLGQPRPLQDKRRSRPARRSGEPTKPPIKPMA